MIAEVAVHEVGEAVHAPHHSGLGPGAGEVDELGSVGDGEGAEQDLVGDGEDGGIGADAESEGEQGDGGEEGRVAQIAKGVAKVLEHPWVHGSAGGADRFA